MIADLSYSEGISTVSSNGRYRAATGGKRPERTGWELIAWAMLELAIEDTTILARYGLITREGECKPWPMIKRISREGHKNTQAMIIATMRDPLDHIRLREFWQDPTQAQLWCDLCGCRLPAKDIWKSILENHAK